MKLAVVGKDVSLSQSPQMHAFLFAGMGERCSYEKVSLPPERFPAEAEGLFARYDGFNVTIPFKREIMPFLRELSEDAEAAGAVNTVLCGRRAGYNTDGDGFLLMLGGEGIGLAGRRALVLGAGGAGRSCIRKLSAAGAEVSVYSRSYERVERLFGEFGGFTPLASADPAPYDLIVNCTGVGMHGNAGSPAGRELISLCDTAVDLIYEPAETEFLRLARECGKKTVNGGAMLFYQAYFADCIYLERKADAAEAKRLYAEYQRGLG